MERISLFLFAATLFGGLCSCGQSSSQKSFDPNNKTVLVEVQENNGEAVVQFLANGTYTADVDMPVSGAWICSVKDGFAADDCEYDAASKTASFSWYNGMFSPEITFTDAQLKALSDHGGNPDGLRKADWGPGPEAE